MVMNELLDITPDKVQAKRELEQSIYQFIYDAMREFRSKTGLSPRDIEINLIEVTKSDDRIQQFMITGVKADVSYTIRVP